MAHEFALTAKLSSNAYFGGDFLYCVVTVTSDGYFLLSAEVHGLCRRDTRWTPHKVVGEPVRAASALALGFGQPETDTSLLECAQPTLLGCEVGGEARVVTYLFYAQLPHELVPSFRGTAFKYRASSVLASFFRSDRLVAGFVSRLFFFFCGCGGSDLVA